jgi:hypothetical protein
LAAQVLAWAVQPVSAAVLLRLVAAVPEAVLPELSAVQAELPPPLPEDALEA